MTDPERREVVMIVDDTPANLRVLCGMLQEQGYAVRPAPSGKLALAAAERNPPDLILLDIMMPDMDGYEVCRRLKQHTTLKGIPVIFLSALSETTDKLKAFEAGGVDYITKPFQFPEVHARVENQLQLCRQRAQLAQQFTELERLEQLRDELVHMIAHDMRSPLTVIDGYLELLAAPITTGGTADYLGGARQSCAELLEMINSLLDVRRIESQQLTLNLARTDLATVAERVVAEFLPLLKRAGLYVTVSPESVTVHCDPELIRRTLRTLLTNAIKFSPDGGVITLDLMREDGFAKVAVSDAGPAIPAEYREAVFGKFESAHGLPPEVRRVTGVGLNFCKLVIEAHGGQVGVADALPHGNTFWFTLPGVLETIAPTAAPAAPLPLAEAALNILVADADRTVRRMMSDLLGARGHEVQRVGDAQVLGQALAGMAFNLVICDLPLARQAGEAFIEPLRNLRTPVVLTADSGSDDDPSSLRAAGVQVVEILSKPVHVSRLRRVLDALTGQETAATVVLTAPAQPRQGIAGYQVRRTLGHGQFGVVYLAEKEFDGVLRKVALKVMHQGLPEEARIRFTREAEALASLSHPNIVAVHDFDVSESAAVPYIAMEYVPGAPLNVRQQQLRQDEYVVKARLLRQVADALRAAHERHLWHRDVKPHNVLVTDEWDAKLADFGVVRTVDSQLTMGGAAIGTPLYMAPEAFDQQRADGRADLFSLGVMSYELLLGCMPFTGETLPAILLAIAGDQPRAPCDLDSNLPPALQSIMAGLLGKAPEDRYQQAIEVVYDLDQFLADPGAVSHVERFPGVWA